MLAVMPVTLAFPGNHPEPAGMLSLGCTVLGVPFLLDNPDARVPFCLSQFLFFLDLRMEGMITGQAHPAITLMGINGIDPADRTDFLPFPVESIAD